MWNWIKKKLGLIKEKPSVTFFAGGRKIVFYKRKKKWS